MMIRSGQHFAGVHGVSGFSENLAVSNYHRVGSQNDLARLSFGPGLFCREPLHMGGRLLTAKRRFVDVDGPDCESKAQAVEDLASPWRTGGENQRRGGGVQGLRVVRGQGCQAQGASGVAL